jgi:nucleoside-diphosphate-sugar epimerase
MGASGFLGARITRRLLARGAEVCLSTGPLTTPVASSDPVAQGVGAGASRVLGHPH